MNHPDAPVTIGEQIGRYVVESDFSAHNPGRLFVARHTILDRRVLLKFFYRANLGQATERTQNEARILARLQHPNIIAVRDIDTHNGQPYLVLNYVEGGRTLADLVQTGSALLPTVALYLIATICSALSHAHEQGVLHKDIKPGNIIIGYDGTPLLLGFEIAAPTSGDPLMPEGVSIGTPPYMSPEQAMSEPLTAATDIWSIGITLHELFTGRVPYEYDEPMVTLEAIAASEPVDLNALQEAVPKPVISILARCLQKDPTARFSSAEALRQALNAAVIELELSEDATLRASHPSTGGQLLLYSEHPATERPGHYRHYQIRALLGSGSFADVYHAIDTLSGAEVALKILKRQWLANEQAVARFRREAVLLLRLSHPNIMKIYDFGQYGESFYLVLELVAGQTLADHLRAHGVLEPHAAAELLIPVLHGLDAAHHLGIVHRDLKPENIGLTPEKVVLLDFGIAYSAFATRITAPGALLGSAGYMSPEQAREQPLTTASDLYAIGTILYEMLTGRLPHEADNLYMLLYKLAAEAPVPITEHRSDLPAQVVQLVALLHQPEPGARPSAHETAELLAGF